MQNQNTLYFYCDNVRIHKQTKKKQKTKIWCKIILQISVEHIKSNWGSYFYLYTFEDLAQGNFAWKFPCVHRLGKLIKRFFNFTNKQ